MILLYNYVSSYPFKNGSHKEDLAYCYQSLCSGSVSLPPALNVSWGVFPFSWQLGVDTYPEFTVSACGSLLQVFHTWLLKLTTRSFIYNFYNTKHEYGSVWNKTKFLSLCVQGQRVRFYSVLPEWTYSPLIISECKCFCACNLWF